MTDEVIVKDFSRKRPKLFIRLDGEQYEARSAIGLPTLQRVQAIRRKYEGDDADKVGMFAEMFDVLLKTDEAARFRVKLQDEDEPVEPSQLQEMVTYLMERNGGRPTPEPSASADGSSNVALGIPSTDGASPDA